MKIKFYASLFFFVGLFSSAKTFGQTDFRTFNSGSGNWNELSTWQMLSEGNWVSADRIPDYTENQITIRSGFKVNVTSEIFVDQVLLEQNGTLEASTGIKLNIGPGPDTGSDFIVNGSIINRGSIVLATIMDDVTEEIKSAKLEVNGIITNNEGGVFSGSSESIAFNSWSTYIHNDPSGTASIPRAIWDANSTIRVKKLAAGTFVPTYINQEFGNFIWETDNGSSGFGGSAIVNFDNILPVIKGNATFQQPDRSNVLLSNSTSSSTNVNFRVDGNLTIDANAQVTFTNYGTLVANIGGDLVFSGYRLRNSRNGNATLNVGGNVNLLSGDYMFNTSSGNSTINFGGNLNFGPTLALTNAASSNAFFIANGTELQLLQSSFATSVPVNFRIGTPAGTGSHFSLNGNNLTTAGSMYVDGNSSLDLGQGYFKSNTGTFSLDGGTVLIANAAGIADNSSLGAIQVPLANRTFAENSTIVYNGNTAQSLGNGYPSSGAINLTVDNPTEVSLAENLLINTGNNLTVKKGTINLAGNTLTVEGDLISENPVPFVGSSTSNLVLGGSSPLPSILFDESGQVLNQLTVNNSNSVTLGSDLTVISLNLASGSLDFGGQDLTLSGAITGPNFLRPSATSTLTINGTANPINLPFEGTPSIRNITFNRETGTQPAYTINSGINVVGTLALLKGTLNNTSGLQLAQGSTFLLDGSSADFTGTRPVAGGAYSIHYQNLPAEFAVGLEFPEEGTAIQNLTLESSPFAAPFGLLLNGDLTIGTGSTFNPNAFDHSLNGNWVNNGNSFEGGINTVSFLGTSAQNISGTGTNNFFNILVSSPTLYNEGTTNLINILTITGSTNFDADGTANTGNFVLVSSAERTAGIATLPSGASVSGEVNAQRFIHPEGNIFRYISTPLTGITLAQWNDDFAAVNNTYYYIEDYWQGGEIGYAPLNSITDRIYNGRGYAALVNNGSTPLVIDMRGPVQQGPVDFHVTYKDTDSPDYDGWNLVGNPYPSSIDVEAAGWTWTNLSPEILIPNNESGNLEYMRYSLRGGGLNNASNHIASGQAFWVIATGPTPVLRATEAVKSNQTETTFYRQGPIPDRLVVGLNHEGARDETAILLRDNATSNFDIELEARRRENSSFDLSSLTEDGINVAFNFIPWAECDSQVQLDIKDVESGRYSLDFSDLSNFSREVKMVLTDQFLDQTADISADLVYEFQVNGEEASSASDRFYITITVAPKISESITARTSCIQENENIIVIAGSQEGRIYQAMFGEIAVSEAVSGTGSKMQLEVKKELLRNGSNIIHVFALNEACGSTYELAQVELLKVQEPEITLDNGIFSMEDVYESYQWYLDGEMIEGAVSNTYEPNESGQYSVQVNKGGCSQTSAAREFILTSVESEAASAGIILAPIPATDFINIHLGAENDFGTEYEIYSTNSVRVIKGTVKLGELSKRVDVQFLTSGMYIIRLAKGERTYVLRFIKN